MSVKRRIELLNLTEAAARDEQLACQRRVDQAHRLAR
jgi:hypothetical protein